MGTKIIKLLHVYKITGPFTFIDPTGHPVLSITGPTANLLATGQRLSRPLQHHRPALSNWQTII
jgi:hypothetical protein